MNPAPFKRILFCTDFSDNADVAFDFALEQARHSPECTIHLLHVVPEPEAQFFKGVWKTRAVSPEDTGWEVHIRTEGDAVVAEITSSAGDADRTPVEHLRMIDGRLGFTFRSRTTGAVVEATSVLDGGAMRMHLRGIEDDLGTVELRRQE